MFQLIYKDLQVYWYVMISQMFFCLLLMTFGLLIDNNANITLLALMMYPTVLPMTLLLMDQKYMVLCNTLPLKRGPYVLSKYVGGLLMSGLILGCGLLYGYSLDYFVISEDVVLHGLFNWKSLFMLMLPIILLNSLAFPFYFKFSKEKGSYVLGGILIGILLVLIVGLIITEKTLVANYGYSQREVFPAIRQWLTNRVSVVGRKQLLASISIGTLGILAISVLMSLWMFSGRDLGGE